MIGLRPWRSPSRLPSTGEQQELHQRVRQFISQPPIGAAFADRQPGQLHQLGDWQRTMPMPIESMNSAIATMAG